MEEEVIKVLSELHYYIQGSPAKPTIRAAG
jgi:hypothetical protein